MQILHYRLEIVEVGSSSAATKQMGVGLGGTFAFQASILKPAAASKLTSEDSSPAAAAAAAAAAEVLIHGSEYRRSYF